MLASTSCSPTWSKICDYNRCSDKALLRVASHSLFEGVVNSLRDILGVEVNSLSRERLQCPCPVPNEKHECRAGRIGAPSQPEYFTCLSGRVVLKDWFKVPIGPTRRAAHTHSGHEHIGGDCGGTDDFCHGCQRVSASNRYLGSSGGLLGVFAEKLIKSMAIGGDGRV